MSPTGPSELIRLNGFRTLKLNGGCELAELSHAAKLKGRRKLSAHGVVRTRRFLSRGRVSRPAGSQEGTGGEVWSHCTVAPCKYGESL